jgi:hypothetical protein
VELEFSLRRKSVHGESQFRIYASFKRGQKETKAEADAYLVYPDGHTQSNRKLVTQAVEDILASITTNFRKL